MAEITTYRNNFDQKPAMLVMWNHAQTHLRLSTFVQYCEFICEYSVED